MQENTKKLLEECNSGCKMAIESMDQVGQYVTDDKLKGVIQDYNTRHKKLESEIFQAFSSGRAGGKRTRCICFDIFLADNRDEDDGKG